MMTVHSMSSNLIVDVAIPVPLGNAFSYTVPERWLTQVRPGSRVLCDFGRRKVIGVVLQTRSANDFHGYDPAKLKPIVDLVDDAPVLSEELLLFLKKLAEYYFSPIGEVMRLALPAMERERVRKLRDDGHLHATEALRRQKQVSKNEEFFLGIGSEADKALNLRGQAATIFERVRNQGEVQLSSLRAEFTNATNAIKKLESFNFIRRFSRELESNAFLSNPISENVPVLNREQHLAVREIENALHHSIQDKARSFLLFGVTGSGKTEVYLRAIASCLAQKRGAIVMVPEIALTPQLVSRFRARFGDALAVLHSGLSDRDRLSMWTRLQSGTVSVAIGARSAVFAPVQRLGLILVDEEHDSSFKQEDGVRYHARDMALLRGQLANAVVVLGSATPSLESELLVQKEKLIRLKLPERANQKAALPNVSIVDMRRMGPGPTGDALVTLPLFRALEETLAAGKQSILFLNRRGFAPSIVCDSCGTTEQCPNCAVALTYHQNRSKMMKCHYCEYSSKWTSQCSACGSSSVVLEGLGTEKLEQSIQSAFPQAKVARLDRDVGSGLKAQAILDRMRDGQIDILVGTQMVTKGHDLPNVTLVGVVNADAALSIPDFRAAERTFQLLVQVAGRAGRHESPGRVLIQTRSTDHPAIQFAVQHDVEGFLAKELMDRREAQYPPHYRMALLRMESLDDNAVRTLAFKIASFIRTTEESLKKHVEVLGPAPAPIVRLRSKYRYRVLIRSQDRLFVRRVLYKVQQAQIVDRRVSCILDVDPVNML